MTSSENSDFDPTNRRLCPDGGCTGLLDAFRTCSECGRTWGEEAVTAVTASALPDDDLELERGPSAFAQGPVEGSNGFDANRELCPDGSCVGVIGAEGVCSECGRRRTDT